LRLAGTLEEKKSLKICRRTPTGGIILNWISTKVRPGFV